MSAKARYEWPAEIYSILGAFSALGDPTAINSAVVLVPGTASTLNIDRLRAAADRNADPAWTGGLRPGPADRRLQRGSHGGIPAGAVFVADPRPVRQRQTRSDAGIDGADDRRAPQQRIAGGQHAAAGQFHPIQPWAYRDHRSGWPAQNLLRMLCDGQDAVREAAAVSLPGVSVRRAGERAAWPDGARAIIRFRAHQSVSRASASR